MKPYTEEALSIAVQEAKQESLTIRAAASKYSVPVSTLYDRVSGRITAGSKWGKPTLLPLAKEKELINHALKRADLGIGFSKETFLRFAGQFAASEGVIFKNGVASEKWWRGLKKRHPEFSLRTPEPTGSGRHMSMTRLRMSQYFSQLKSVLVENNLLDKSPYIWNMDETGISLSTKSPKVFLFRLSYLFALVFSFSIKRHYAFVCGVNLPSWSACIDKLFVTFMHRIIMFQICM